MSVGHRRRKWGCLNHGDGVGVFLLPQSTMARGAVDHHVRSEIGERALLGPKKELEDERKW